MFDLTKYTIPARTLIIGLQRQYDVFAAYEYVRGLDCDDSLRVPEIYTLTVNWRHNRSFWTQSYTYENWHDDCPLIYQPTSQPLRVP